MKILFVGDLNDYTRSFQRFKALKVLGNFVEGISMVPVPFLDGMDKITFFTRLRSKIGLPIDQTRANEALLLKFKNFDLVWIDKGLCIWPSTLRKIKKNSSSALIYVSEDDMYARHNNSIYSRLGFKYYDAVFTTKTYNLEELKTIGAKKTFLFLDSYDEDLHRPLELSEEDKRRFGADVGFIGTFEKDRAERMLFLANKGVKVVVWGNGWSSYKNKNTNLIIKDQPLLGEDYVRAINAIKINLCFLRKMNRDEVTSRSVEIPACAAFMLGERTKRHLEFFREGEEAEFFKDDEELLSKVNFYLKDEASRVRIGEKARQRCLSSGYSTKEQMDKILKLTLAS